MGRKSSVNQESYWLGNYLSASTNAQLLEDTYPGISSVLVEMTFLQDDLPGATPGPRRITFRKGEKAFFRIQCPAPWKCIGEGFSFSDEVKEAVKNPAMPKEAIFICRGKKTNYPYRECHLNINYKITVRQDFRPLGEDD